MKVIVIYPRKKAPKFWREPPRGLFIHFVLLIKKRRLKSSQKSLTFWGHYSEAAGVHYYYTKKSNNKLNVIPSNKKRERLFIVVCVKVAVNRLLLLGKIKTIGLIFSHETAGLLASFTTISKSLSNLNLWVNIFHSFFWVNYNV